MPLRANGHQLQGFGPTLDHLVYWKRNWTAILRRTIKLFAVDECASIIYLNNVGVLGFFAAAVLDYLILQSVG